MLRLLVNVSFNISKEVFFTQTIQTHTHPYLQTHKYVRTHTYVVLYYEFVLGKGVLMNNRWIEQKRISWIAQYINKFFNIRKRGSYCFRGPLLLQKSNETNHWRCVTCKLFINTTTNNIVLISYGMSTQVEIGSTY